MVRTSYTYRTCFNSNVGFSGSGRGFNFSIGFSAITCNFFSFGDGGNCSYSGSGIDLGTNNVGLLGSDSNVGYFGSSLSIGLARTGPDGSGNRLELIGFNCLNGLCGVSIGSLGSGNLSLSLGFSGFMA